MTRKLIRTGIVMVGFALALGSNAWAGHGRHAKRYHYDKGYHHGHKPHHGHPYGWTKGKRHYHKRCYRHHRAYRHRGYHRRPTVIEKHVYHHYAGEDSVEENESFKFAFSLADEVFGIFVEISDSD